MRKILIVDDDEPTRVGLAMLVREAGFDTVTAGTVPAAIRLLSDERPDRDRQVGAGEPREGRVQDRDVPRREPVLRPDVRSRDRRRRQIRLGEQRSQQRLEQPERLYLLTDGCIS